MGVTTINSVIKFYTKSIVVWWLVKYFMALSLENRYLTYSGSHSGTVKTRPVDYSGFKFYSVAFIPTNEDTMQTLSQQSNRDKIRELAQQLHKIFTEHPAATGETYLEHLWFTVSMSTRFVIVSAILLTHGILPFTFTRTASNRIEKIYAIMKDRALKTRGDLADMYHI